MRVLFINPLGELGGSERSLLDLLVSLGQPNVQIERRLLLMADGELATRARQLGVDVELLPMPASLRSLGESGAARRGERAMLLARGALATMPYLLAFRRAVLRTRPDVLHTNGMKAHLAARLAVPEMPTVIHLRDFASQRPLTRHVLFRHRARALFVANSRAVEADILQIAPHARTRVIYNAIDVNEFAEGGADPSHLAGLAGLKVPEPGTLVVGMVATYAWWKGHRTFLAAAARLLERTRAPLRFYIVGGPIYGSHGSEITRAELETLIQSAGLSGKVGLVPFQLDVAAAYRGMDVVIHPSERPEPFGRTIVEAMAAGKPVVVARAGGAVELFRDGESGLAFTASDAEDCARAVLSLVESDTLRRRLGHAARAEASTRFNRDRLGNEALAVYRELVR